MTAKAIPITDAKPKQDSLKAELAHFKRRRIREEAAHLIFQQGYESATIDAIAERLQVTKPFIYSYYKNKGEILSDISRLGITLSLQKLDECLQTSGTYWDRLKLIVDRVTRLVLDNEECIVVYVREEKNLDEEAAREIRELRSLFDHRLAELLIAGNEAGEFHIDSPGPTAKTISGMMSWVAFWYMPDGHWSESEIIANLMQNTARMVHSQLRLDSMDLETRQAEGKPRKSHLGPNHVAP